jgi:protein PhnA
MSTPDDDYVYDDLTGEWRPASEVKAAQASTIEVRDASGNILADGIPWS